ncbi:MAG: UDP-N-acetylmuramoyl-L-alanine--D-glutamate ligase [Chloroflexi bacterium]|nr:UDP-N-acetylmuramoyl-L-alanine--D-glutamate ligase [Anaerolineaceae bacterium]NMB88074.1 UDP-N-acetylmuramoyl-L-alanine--D-glutamate ligase [Chloroflexota bacterium]
MNDWNGQRVLILGAARQGLALARFLAQHGASVTLNDQHTPQQLSTAQAELDGLPVRWVLGQHPLRLLEQTDLVCVSGGVPLSLPIIQAALHMGLPLSNDSQIFMQAVPCPVIGLTGSAGKTTTTTLLGRMAEAGHRPEQKVWVGGNIGRPLITFVEEMRPGDLVILELSSFQLELMSLSPQVAAVLNVTPNHLDRHGTLEAYTAAKRRILDFQAPQNVAVLCHEDPGAWALAGAVRGGLSSFGFSQPPQGRGACLQDGWVNLVADGRASPVLPQAEVRLRGDHNLMNVLAACAIAGAAGFSPQAMRTGVQGFTGVPHRLELVRELNGVAWYNDSIATAPERTMAAIRAFSEPLVLLLGGRDKDLPWQSLAQLVHARVDHVVVFGEAAPKILAALGTVTAGQRPYTLERCDSLQEAIQAAANVAEAGDVVLLSPGGTSFDAFKDFEERGEYYRKWITQLT